MTSRVESILQPAERELFEFHSPEGRDVIELGNKKNVRGLYREWYKLKGARSYRCLDINGEDGAEVVDFREPLDVGTADIVTNFGFTEHVGPDWEFQQVCWENVLKLVRDVLFCVTPGPGQWDKHGMWQPHPEFYAAIAEANGYRVQLLDKDRAVHNRYVVRAVLEKTQDCEFAWDDGWRELIHRTPKTEYV